MRLIVDLLKIIKMMTRYKLLKVKQAKYGASNY